MKHLKNGLEGLLILVTLALALGMMGIGPVISYAVTTYTNSVGLNEVVPATCIPQIANTLITFPATTAGNFVGTANAENVINVGNAASNILVFGTNWIAATDNFFVYNTLWDSVSGGNIGTQLSFTATDTKIPMLANGGGNVIYFGLNIPVAQSAASYNQVITIESSC